MTHHYNQDDKCIILNGYQCYLKRMTQVIAHEVESAKKMGYNLGLKLVRGAYMREERELAAQVGLESPVCENLEDTHTSYNKCLTTAISAATPKSLVFVACHNQDSINIAKKMIMDNQFEDHRVRFGQLKAFSD
jgi:proline dehydrogenase